MIKFKLKKTANTANTSLRGYFPCSYERLVEVFGKPHYSDSSGPDVYNEWSFGRKDRKHGVSLYDHKSTGNAKKYKSYDWHIGATSRKAATEFIKWLESELSK